MVDLNRIYIAESIMLLIKDGGNFKGQGLGF